MVRGHMVRIGMMKNNGTLARFQLSLDNTSIKHRIYHAMAFEQRCLLTRFYVGILHHIIMNPMQTDIGRSNFEKTCLDRYGKSSVLSSDDVRSKIRDTMNVRYGGNGAMCSAFDFEIYTTCE